MHFSTTSFITRAAYVHSDQPQRIQYSPKGKVKSDVLSQSFVSGQTLLNGTRNGSSWLWDLRASRRAQELTRNEAHSLVHVWSLQDGIRVVSQTSHGELSVSDLRMMKPVMTYSPGFEDTYLPTLKFAVVWVYCCFFSSQLLRKTFDYLAMTNRMKARRLLQL